MSRAAHCAAIALVAALFPSRGPAQSPLETCAPGDSCRGFGLVFTVALSPHFTSINAFADGGYALSLGFGVNFSPRFQAIVNIYTGREEIPAGAASPVDGWLPLGGASLEATYYFVTASTFRPYAAAGWGLYTLAGGNGYNGGGVHLESGVEWDFSRYFSLRAGARGALINYHDPTGEASQAAAFRPFTMREAGAALRLAFYPTTLP